MLMCTAVACARAHHRRYQRRRVNAYTHTLAYVGAHARARTHTTTTFIYPTTGLSADSAFEARSRAGPAEDEIRTSEFI